MMAVAALALTIGLSSCADSFDAAMREGQRRDAQTHAAGLANQADEQVTIATEPAGAAILTNGQFRGYSPLAISVHTYAGLFPGTITVRAVPTGANQYVQETTTGGYRWSQYGWMPPPNEPGYGVPVNHSIMLYMYNPPQ
jgi:hypothetical protein